MTANITQGLESVYFFLLEDVPSWEAARYTEAENEIIHAYLQANYDDIMKQVNNEEYCWLYGDCDDEEDDEF